MKLYHKTFILFVFTVTGALGACNYISSRDLERPQSQSNFFEKLKSSPKFVDIYERIFVRSCNRCHSPEGSGHRVLLDLDSLLNSPLDLVIPGNADESGLLISIERTDIKRMPPPDKGFKSLSPAEIAAIKTWIANGAKD